VTARGRSADDAQRVNARERERERERVFNPTTQIPPKTRRSRGNTSRRRRRVLPKPPVPSIPTQEGCNNAITCRISQRRNYALIRAPVFRSRKRPFGFRPPAPPPALRCPMRRVFFPPPALSSSGASSANFADQSPRPAIVADRRDAVTKLIRRSLQRAILRVGEFGLGGGAQRTAAFRPVKGKNDQLVETGTVTERTANDRRCDRGFADVSRQRAAFRDRASKIRARARITDLSRRRAVLVIGAKVKPQCFPMMESTADRKERASFEPLYKQQTRFVVRTVDSRVKLRRHNRIYIRL